MYTVSPMDICSQLHACICNLHKVRLTFRDIVLFAEILFCENRKIYILCIQEFHFTPELSDKLNSEFHIFPSFTIHLDVVILEVY